MERKLQEGHFDFEDFRDQLHQIKKMGPLTDILGMLPGMGRVMKEIDLSSAEGNLKKTEAIINSMTAKERRNPNLLDGSRRRRIAAGSGTSVQDVNQLVKQFREMQKMMKQMGIMGGGKGKRKGRGRGGMPKGLMDMFGGFN